ncbi:uncharacterized protein BT62DRAFT_423785 [Guyanagaster necrorhizus]|uniref:Uncharacterized protein n=1 Tax=Guyanagaster necrorhizus TaxID=856835 RepID=A0A9P7W518_9AGAR|nr:uncharacterized protein BT62DRAFT_423785 [Guyanagaster necrorhizus MCA 3950]KAG7451436.1 hypothetical protein BT62DRAFT_423785 [Guyanagaster necrorhizus MCA 3950]
MTDRDGISGLRALLLPEAFAQIVQLLYKLFFSSRLQFVLNHNDDYLSNTLAFPFYTYLSALLVFLLATFCPNSAFTPPR